MDKFDLTEFLVQLAPSLGTCGLLLLMAWVAVKSPHRWLHVGGVVSCVALGLAASYLSLGILTTRSSYLIIFQEPGWLGGWKIFVLIKLLLAALGMAGMWLCLWRKRYAGFATFALAQVLASVLETAWMRAHGFLSWF